MFDEATADLIRSTPVLDGLDRENLPKQLTDVFARIVAARVRMRTEDAELEEDLRALLDEMRRLAVTNEALVAVSPEREDRAAAAFVSASAHQAGFNAERLIDPGGRRSYLSTSSISSDISAMLLYLVAEAMADAAEIARRIRYETSDPIERSLISALRNLALGRLSAIVEAEVPALDYLQNLTSNQAASAALYVTVFKGLRELAAALLSPDALSAPVDYAGHFRSVQRMSYADARLGGERRGGETIIHKIGAFPGPHHLASLLIAVTGDLTNSAVVSVDPPGGTDAAKWRGSLRRIAETRPFLWRNHRDAIAQGYLEAEVSSVVGFPTGAGKSTLAELMINATLLLGKMVVFLAPTHALVDQTTQGLRRSFPTASVQGEKLDEFGFGADSGNLPGILVMTPEACLTQMSIDSSVFEDVGLLVFDECHLMHPSDDPQDRRAIDSMLCVLNMARLVPSADLLLLSAMMKNTEELAEWLMALTGRKCLALSLSWKPARQLRGSVVYAQDEIKEINSNLVREKAASKIKGIPTAVQRATVAKPLGFFGLRQTWESRRRDDYSLQPLLDEAVPLGIASPKNRPWHLTPNAGVISSAIAAAAARDGMKVLVFFQTIKNAWSAVGKITLHLGGIEIPLRDDEQGWYDIAALEFGGEKHLYCTVKDGKAISPAGVHHGLLLPEERRLIESLYRRKDGVRVLAATSTLAQGMNLPSELVIIAEDSRYDDAKNKRELLKAQELLNAAGRAGRAGENANGVVLVVPGKVVGIDVNHNQIGRHWTTLQAIFGQSDQCLDIDDPLTAFLDRVHDGGTTNEQLDAYVVGRLAALGDGKDAVKRINDAVRSTFGGYRAQRDHRENWLTSRISAAVSLYSAQREEVDPASIESDVAATIGVPIEVVTRLSGQIAEKPPKIQEDLSAWRRWFFRWLADNPDLLDQIFRRQSLDELFGTNFAKIEDPKKRAALAVPRLVALSGRWMAGAPLKRLEAGLGVDPKKLKECNGARRFVLRIVPELSYLFGLPALLHQRRLAADPETPTPAAASLHIGRCMRAGVKSLEQLAFADVMSRARLSRRQIHQRFAEVAPYLSSRLDSEPWEATQFRVEAAIDKELMSRQMPVVRTDE